MKPFALLGCALAALACTPAPVKKPKAPDGDAGSTIYVEVDAGAHGGAGVGTSASGSTGAAGSRVRAGSGALFHVASRRRERSSAAPIETRRGAIDARRAAG